jgi:integrase/recombinase XerD
VHSVPDPSRVRFGGPLAPFAPGLAVELASLGYTRTSATMQMQLAASLSRWLDAAGISLGELTGPVMERFLSERRARGTSHYSPRALTPIVDYLRRVGVVSAVVASAPPVTVVEVLLERFARYLATQRALTPPVVRAYVHWVGPFTEDVLCPAGVDRVGEVSAGEVAAFLAARLPVMSRKSAQMTACALRSLLRFLHAEALVDAALVDAVPSVASWRLSGLPQALTSSQVQALRHACEGSDPVGRRDLAVIILMRRLGLRCAEVAALRLEDIDWPAGTVTIHGKGNRIDRMPLPVDAGQAVVDYLRGGRGGHERSHGVRPREGTVHAVAFLERQLHRGPGRSTGGAGNRARAPVAPYSGDRDVERRCGPGRGRPVDASRRGGHHGHLR